MPWWFFRVFRYDFSASSFPLTVPFMDRVNKLSAYGKFNIIYQIESIKPSKRFYFVIQYLQFFYFIQNCFWVVICVRYCFDMLRLQCDVSIRYNSNELSKHFETSQYLEINRNILKTNNTMSFSCTFEAIKTTTYCHNEELSFTIIKLFYTIRIFIFIDGIFQYKYLVPSI